MRKMIVCLGIIVLFAATAIGQTKLDDFETTCTGWSHTGGWSVAVWDETDGADGTSKSMEVEDSGWSKGVEKTFSAIVPADGNYKVTFYYKNGHRDNAWPDLEVQLNNANTVSLGSSVVDTWTADETGVASGLTAGDDVTVTIAGSSSAQADNVCAFDEFYLEEVAVAPIAFTVRPLDGYYVAGTQTIVAEDISGGSETYTQAEFDIGDDGSVEHTDSDPGDGFSYDWDTTSVSDGAVAVKVTVTDDSSATGNETVNYTVDNTHGREEMVLNGGFESWSGTLPDNWTKVDFDSDGNSDDTNSTVTKEIVDPKEGNNALKVSFTASDYTYRYTMMSNSFDGDRSDYIAWFWAKGGSDTRMCYFASDDGSAWISTWHIMDPAAGPNWTEFMDTAYTPDPLSTYMSICTHKFSSGDSWWDDVSVTASTIHSGISDWDLY